MGLFSFVAFRVFGWVAVRFYSPDSVELRIDRAERVSTHTSFSRNGRVPGFQLRYKSKRIQQTRSMYNLVKRYSSPKVLLYNPSIKQNNVFIPCMPVPGNISFTLRRKLLILAPISEILHHLFRWLEFILLLGVWVSLEQSQYDCVGNILIAFKWAELSQV